MRLRMPENVLELRGGRVRGLCSRKLSSGPGLYLVVQYLGVLKVNLWDSKGNLLTQKG